MLFSQYFKITGVANAITYEDGLQSTPAEKKTLRNVRLILNGQADNQIQGYLEKAKVFDYPDRLIDVEADAFNTNTAKPGARMNEITVDMDIEVGHAFKVAIKCGASAKDVYGCYEYEIAK